MPWVIAIFLQQTSSGLQGKTVHTAATCAVDYNICCVEAQGSQSTEAFQQAGQKAAAAFAHYEGTPKPQTVQEGQEPQGLLAALGGAQSAACAPQQCPAYDADFQACALSDTCLCTAVIGHEPSLVLLLCHMVHHLCLAMQYQAVQLSIGLLAHGWTASINVVSVHAISASTQPRMYFSCHHKLSACKCIQCAGICMPCRCTATLLMPTAVSRPVCRLLAKTW